MEFTTLEDEAIADASTLAPHEPQNFAPSFKAAPHDSKNIVFTPVHG